MVMAEAERAGGGQNDMERELTCSVSSRGCGRGRGLWRARGWGHELARVGETDVGLLHEEGWNV
jgi:hypothetical protein